MFTRLLRRNLWSCVEAGRRILAPLEADRRLADAAATLRPAQDVFEACVRAVEENSLQAGWSAAARADALRRLADELRGFGLFLLSLTRNHPRLEPCPGYFREGYGEALRLTGEDLADFVDVTIAKILCESDPRIRAWLEPLAVARDAYAAAAATAREDAFLRDEAFALARKERRAWARAVVAARHRAEEACFGERTYTRVIFAPAADGRGTRKEETKVAEEGTIPLTLHRQLTGERHLTAEEQLTANSRRAARGQPAAESHRALHQLAAHVDATPVPEEKVKDAAGSPPASRAIPRVTGSLRGFRPAPRLGTGDFGRHDRRSPGRGLRMVRGRAALRVKLLGLADRLRKAHQANRLRAAGGLDAHEVLSGRKRSTGVIPAGPEEAMGAGGQISVEQHPYGPALRVEDPGSGR